MNNSGQVSLLALMLATVVILMALGLAYSVWQGSNSAYNTMNCSSTTDDFVKAACYTLDLTPFFFIGILISLAGIVLVSKIIYG